MEAPRLERRLIAIFAVDVEGYSRHMERDEAATLATLSGHRVIVDDLVASHNGRITGTAGDDVLAEFQSVVDALDCAMKMQDAIAVASENLPTENACCSASASMSATSWSRTAISSAMA